MQDESVAAVRVEGVSKIYSSSRGSQVEALRDVSLTVSRGEMVALVGPSGCGKTTLLSLVGCIDVPSSGTVNIEGAHTASLNEANLTKLRRDRIGVIFQAFNLLPTLSVTENISVPLVIQGCPREETRERVAEILSRVGLREKARAFPGQLSGGEAQRVAVARAVVHSPAILLADEPTGNLDPDNADGILELLRALANQGQAILIATHSSSATSACDRVATMERGSIARWSHAV